MLQQSRKEARGRKFDNPPQFRIIPDSFSVSIEDHIDTQLSGAEYSVEKSTPQQPVNPSNEESSVEKSTPQQPAIKEEPGERSDLPVSWTYNPEQPLLLESVYFLNKSKSKLVPTDTSPSVRKNGSAGMAMGEPIGRTEWNRPGVVGVLSTSPGATNSGVAATAAGTLGTTVRGCGGGEWSDGLGGPKCAGFRVGIYGWRKRCLYLLVLSLMVMVIVNLALTLWLLKVMEFSTEGMGQLRIVAGGIQLNGQAMILDSLVASSIRSRRGQPITIESSRNFSINTRNDDGRILNRLFLGEDRFEVQARSFRVLDPRGAPIFTANQKEVVVGAEVLKVTGAGGAVFDGTVQTPLLRADSGFDLRLESPTRSLEIKGPLGVAIESRAGDITATCLTDLKLQSVAGAVRLDSSNVLLPSLKTVNVSPISYGPSAAAADGVGLPRRTSIPEVFQLCICGNGKLFLAPPEGICIADNDVCR